MYTQAGMVPLRELNGSLLAMYTQAGMVPLRELNGSLLL